MSDYKPKRKANRNAKKSKHTKTDSFTLAIQEMIDFDAKPITDSFREDRIRSSDFSLDGFKKRQEFVVEYCINKKALKFTAAKLIKLYQALNKKYRITGLCERVPSIPNIFNSGSLVFISPKYTQQIIDNKFIHSLESNTLDSPKRLYQYLNWTIRVNKINKYVNCFSTKNKENNIQFLLINSELHDQHNNVLYMFCIENDIISEKAQKWQFVKLVTAAELTELVPDCALDQIIKQYMDDHLSVCSVDMNNITSITSLISQFMGNYCDQDRILPLGARKNGQQFEQLKQQNMMTKDDIVCSMNNTSYLQLKGIQTGYDKKRGNKQVLRISLNEFQEKIYDAAVSTAELIPIVSILSGKKYGDGDYSVDQVLPVNIRDDDWIGICYRAGKPVMVLFDGYDITNKAILCSPTFDKDSLSFFDNNIYKIEITPRDYPQPSQMQPVQVQQPFYNDTASLSSPSAYTPTPDSQMEEFDITPLALESVSSDNDQDEHMQFENPPDHPYDSSGSSINQQQIYEQKLDDNQQNEEMKYNYVNIAYNNDVQTDGMKTNTSTLSMNTSMHIHMNRTNGLNGEGLQSTNTNTIRNTNSIPMSMDGINSTMNTNTNAQTTSTPNMGFVNYVQNMNHQINGQYQFKSKNQPQQTQQQLYPQQIYINNVNNLNMLLPMMPNLQLQNTLTNMNIPTPNEGFQTTLNLPNLQNLPPMTLQNTTFIPVPVYCYGYPLPTIQPPFMHQPQFQMMMPQPQIQPQAANRPVFIPKASTPEFVPISKSNRSSSIPKPASIVPTISTIREEI